VITIFERIRFSSTHVNIYGHTAAKAGSSNRVCDLNLPLIYRTYGMSVLQKQKPTPEASCAVIFSVLPVELQAH